jgi:hypothetical protein
VKSEDVVWALRVAIRGAVNNVPTQALLSIRMSEIPSMVDAAVWIAMGRLGYV